MPKCPSAEYCAGLFDGEGSIIPIVFNGKHRRVGAVRVTLGLKNRGQCLTSAMEFRYGGKTEISMLRGKPLYYWHLAQVEGIKNALNDMLPYLRLKAEEARVALIMLKTSRSRYESGKAREHSAVEFQERLNCYMELKRLHGRPYPSFISDLIQEKARLASEPH